MSEKDVVQKYMDESNFRERYARFARYRLTEDDILRKTAQACKISQDMHKHQMSMEFLKIALLRAYELGVSDQQEGYDLSSKELPDDYLIPPEEHDTSPGPSQYDPAIQ